ncbi:MAG TPA: methionine adenosyltransferase [Candidatus Dormibacteraeota bacterium]|nr:methionine adenosyltransferase [Candidatus Dormibacteraeota bacterium]
MSLEINAGFVAPDKLVQEVVERKGLGHPDTLVDGIVEATEMAYATYCQETFGAIPHHNLDKAALVGGLCIQRFGGSLFEAPLNMIFMGRASKSFGDKNIPLEEIQDQTSRDYLKRILPHLNTADPSVYNSRSLTTSHSTRPYWFAPRNIDDLPEYSGDTPRANDTATMISYWPLTVTEKLALDLEGYFYEDTSEDLPVPRFSHIGQDIKVMCVRTGRLITATMCIPQVTTETPSKEVYYERERELELTLQQYAEEKVAGDASVRVVVNTQTKSPNPYPYLVTGGSCTDFGEEGAVGRGNKTHNIISSFRPNTMEAPHGKNVTYFVGKLLGYQADAIAKNVYEQTGSRCQVIIQANMGDNLFDPTKVVVSTEAEVDRDVTARIVEESLGLGRQTTDIILATRHFLPRTNTFKS